MILSECQDQYLQCPQDLELEILAIAKLLIKCEGKYRHFQNSEKLPLGKNWGGESYFTK